MALTEINSLGIKDGEVKTDDIAADAVTGAKIADDAINSEHYTDASIDTAHIADDAVTADKLANAINTSIDAKMPLAGGTFTGDVTFDNQSNAGRDVRWDESVDSLEFDDNTKATFGADGDLQIYHNGSASYIADSGTGELVLKSNSLSFTNAGESEHLARFYEDGSVVLYHDGSSKLTTTAAGITVTGTVTATGGGLGGLFSSYALVWDQKASDTAGGSFDNGAWRTRDLNTEEDPDSIVSISSNEFTLAAGSYLIKWKAPAYDVQTHMSRLVDVTNSNVYVGTTELAWSADTVQSWSTGIKRVTIGGNTAFRIEHQCENSQGTNGFGIYLDWDSLVNMYTQVEIYKEA